MKNLICTILIFIPFLAQTQDTLITESDTIITDTGLIEVDQVEVIKAFEANLQDAKKIVIKPKIKPVIPVDASYDYDITIVPLQIDYPEPVIKPLAMNPDPADPKNKFYSRIGYGDLKSPYADVSYHHQKGDEMEYTISGHFYGADDSETIAFRKFYESDLNVDFGYRVSENYKVNVDLEAGYDLRNLYDTVFVKTPEVLTEEEVKRNVLRYKIRAGVANIEAPGSGINTDVGLTLQRIKFDSQLNSSEEGMGLDFAVNKSFSKKLNVYINGNGAIHSITYPNGNSNDRNAVTFNPGVNLSLGNFRLNASADIFIDDNQTSPFPEIELMYSLPESGLQLFAGTKQVAIANTLWNHYINNPFVSGAIPINKTTLSRQFYGGLSGKIKDFLTFNFMGGYADIKDQFYYDDLGLLRLWVNHTDMTNVFINANIDFKLTETISIGANVSQNFYSPEELEILPNNPEYKYTGYSKIRLMDGKFVFSMDLNLMDQISYLDDSQNIILGNSQIDLSLGVDFYITENIGLWFRGNNLLDREYLRFSNYPEFGRNLLGGLLVKF